MATNPEFSKNSSQTGDQSTNDYANVWDYFGDIGLNDQELSEIAEAKPSASAEYRSERLQSATGQSEEPSDTASAVVKIDHSSRPGNVGDTAKIGLDPKATAAQDPVGTQGAGEIPANSVEQPSQGQEVPAGLDQEIPRSTHEKIAGSPYTAEELEQYRLPGSIEEAKAQNLLESFEENGLGHTPIDETIRFALKSPGARVALNDDQKGAFEEWMKDHSDWMDSDDARRVWGAVAPDSEKWRDPAHPDDDVSKLIGGGFTDSTEPSDGEALVRSQRDSGGKVIGKLGKFMPSSARFITTTNLLLAKQEEKALAEKERERAAKAERIKKIVRNGARAVAVAASLGNVANPLVAAMAKTDAGGGASQNTMTQAQGGDQEQGGQQAESQGQAGQYVEDELHQITQMSQSQLANVAKEARNQQESHYNANNLPEADYHMWGHDNGDGTYDCSFKKTASSFTGAIDMSSQETITRHIMESCESTPEQLAGMSASLLPQDVLEQNGYDGDINNFADHLEEDNEARANILNAFREAESRADYQQATLADGTLYKSFGINRMNNGEFALLAGGNRIAHSEKDVLIVSNIDSQGVEHRMMVDPDCDNLIEVQVNGEGEVVQSRVIHEGGGSEEQRWNDQGGGEEQHWSDQGGGKEFHWKDNGGGEERREEKKEEHKKEEKKEEHKKEEKKEEHKEEGESKKVSEVNDRTKGSQERVSTSDERGDVNNPVGRTDMGRPGGIREDTVRGNNNPDTGNSETEKPSGGSQSTTVTTPSGSSITGTGGTSNSDGTRTNAGATVRGKDGSTETANEARQKAVEADGSDGFVNDGIVNGV